MANLVSQLGDQTSRSTTPDFNTGKGWAWEKMTKEAMQFGGLDNLPRKPRKGLAEHAYWGAVDRHMSRKSFTQSFALVNGRVVRDEEE